MTSASALADDQPRAPHALAGAVAGVLAGAVAVGAAQLAAGLTVPQSSPVLAVGQAAIDLTPAPVKDFAISSFGTADKTALIGILAVRRLAFGMWGLALFAFIGLVAALSRPGSTAEYIVPTLAGAAAGPPAPPPAPPAPSPAPETLAPPDLPAPPAGADTAAQAPPGSSFTYLPN